MQIKKELVASIIESAAAIDNVSRRKTVSAEERLANALKALTFVRSLLSTLRKLK